MPLTTQAERTSNIGIRNFETTTIITGNNRIVIATNFLEMDAELVVDVDREKLPRGWRVTLPKLRERKLTGRTSIERKALLLGAKGPLLHAGETIYVPVRVEPGPGAKPGQEVDIPVHAALRPLIAGRRQAVGNGFSYRVVIDPKRDCK